MASGRHSGTALPEIIKRRVDIYRDFFAGTAEAIVEAGLARWDELPGQSGCGKTMCSYLPDGSRAFRTGRSAHWHQEGYRRISRRAHGRIVVEITVAKEEFERRREAYLANLGERIRSDKPRASHLSLVWSRPN